MKLLIIHSLYKQKGGEDVVYESEVSLLQKKCTVRQLTFLNEGAEIFKFLFLPFNPLSYIQVIRNIRKFQPDVIHLHNWHFAASPSVIMAAKQMNVPVVYTQHNYRLLCPSAILLHNGSLFLNSLIEEFPWSAVINKVYRQSVMQTFWLAFSVWLHKMLGTWKSVDKYIVLTNSSKELFLTSALSLKEEQVTIKPNFINNLSYRILSRENHFLFIGRLTEEKGIKFLLETIKQSKFHLKIIGDGPLKAIVEQYENENSNIQYLGYKEKDFILNELSKCSALIFPSLWYEGMPITIIEAFATSTPVIASRLGAMHSMVKDGFNGLHFTQGDIEDLKAKICKWWSLVEEEKETYRNNARSTYELHYTPEKNLEQLLSIYNSVVQKPN